MLLFFFLALLIGWLQGRQSGAVFRRKSLIPYFLLELCYIGIFWCCWFPFWRTGSMFPPLPEQVLPPQEHF